MLIYMAELDVRFLFRLHLSILCLKFVKFRYYTVLDNKRISLERNQIQKSNYDRYDTFCYIYFNHSNDYH